MKHGRIVDGCLLVIGLGFALLGQVYLFYRQEYALDAAVFWCLAVLAFVLLARRVGRGERGRSHSRPWIGVAEHPWRVLSALCGACLSLAVGWAARWRQQAADFTPLLVLWLVGVGLFLVPSRPTSRSGRWGSACWAACVRSGVSWLGWWRCCWQR